MSTSSVSTTSSYWITPSSTTSSSSTSGTSDLSDFDTFLKLLATELQNQDPTNPVSNTEYVSQIAQVKSLSQLQTLSDSMDSYRAYSLIGKTVTYETTDSSGSTVTASGTVQSVTTKNNETSLVVNGQSVSISSVQTVSDSSTSSAT